MYRRLLLCGLLLATLSACTYDAAVSVSPAFNVYSSYTDRVPGRWALVTDLRAASGDRDVKPSSYVCSAHTYKLAIGNTFEESVRRTMENVFEEVTTRTSPMTREQMMAEQVRGNVVVRVDTFEPRLRFSMGFWSASADASVDMSMSVVVSGPSGRMFGTSVGATRSADGDAGGACAGGSDVVARAVELTVRDVLERLAERIANARRLRETGATAQAPPGT